jgi:hypothetical protein
MFKRFILLLFYDHFIAIADVRVPPRSLLRCDTFTFNNGRRKGGILKFESTVLCRPAPFLDFTAQRFYIC